MDDDKPKHVITIRTRWWFLWVYVPALKLFCVTTGFPYDEEQFDALLSAYVRTFQKAVYAKTARRC